MESSSSSESTPRPGSEKPTFEGYLSKYLDSLENGPAIKTNVLYLAIMLNMHNHAEEVRKISRLEGKYAEDSEEFKKAQATWWAHYREVNKLRACAMVLYDMNPDWRTDVMPEHYYLGRLTSMEDTEKYLRNPPAGCGLVVQKASTVDELVEEATKTSDSDDEM